MSRAGGARLRVSSNRRYLERGDGAPFLYVGDTAWELFHRLSREEAEHYLVDRAAKGFTVIQAVVLAELDGLTQPNANGDLPLVSADPDQPVEPYFAHVDRIVERANELGLVVGMLPTWGRYWKRTASSQTGPQTGSDEAIFTRENARSYGRWLGNRYADADLIWILGGDRDIDTAEERAIVDAMATGLREGDGGEHLQTFHPRGPGRSGEQLHDADWIDFHMCQTSHGARGHDTGLFIESDYALTPTKPVLDGEPRYESIPVGFYLNGHNPAVRFTDYDARTAAWWAVLAGACGHTYGNNNIWQMWDRGREPVLSANVRWHEALAHPGSIQMGYLRRMLERIAWWTLRPAPLRDPLRSIDSQGGIPELLVDAPSHGPAKVRAAIASDGSCALAYSPQGEPFSLRLAALAPRRVRERWFNPRYGTLHDLHIASNRAFQTYTPPTRGPECDWLLVLTAE